MISLIERTQLAIEELGKVTEREAWYRVIKEIAWKYDVPSRSMLDAMEREGWHGLAFYFEDTALRRGDRI